MISGLQGIKSLNVVLILALLIANVGKMPVTLVNLTVFLFLCRLFINRKLQDEKAYLSAFVAAGCGCDCLWR